VLTKSLSKNLVIEQEITQAYLLMKDFVDFLVILYGFIIDGVTISEVSNLTQDKHNKHIVCTGDTNDLLIVNTVGVINKTVQLFVAHIESVYNNENIDFYRWIKEKWTMISLSVGVILIHVTHVFPMQNNMQQDESRNVYDMNGIQILL
jgi:hypothetical protein